MNFRCLRVSENADDCTIAPAGNLRQPAVANLSREDTSHTTTTVTRKVERPGDSQSETEDGKEVTVTETKETSGGGPGIGILSETVRAIGYVLALPFRIIGGLLTIIF